MAPLVDRLPLEKNSAVVWWILEILPCHGGHILHDLGRAKQEFNSLLNGELRKGGIAIGRDEVNVRQLVGNNC